MSFEQLAQCAVDEIREGMTVSLGTGRTAAAMIRALGARVRRGFRVQAVATSSDSAALARECGIRLLSLEEAGSIDLAIDGVDEIDPEFNAIKGGGGALFREKINASMARQVIWILADAKRVPVLGAFPLPVEFDPYALPFIAGYLSAEQIPFSVRPLPGEAAPFLTDNGNHILDLKLGRIEAPEAVYARLKAVPGILEVGLFNNMCDKIIVDTPTGAVTLINPRKRPAT